MNTKDFKTKTEMINRDNGNLAGIWLIGLDIGYSAVKIFAPNKTAIFPSYAKPFVNHGTVGKLPQDYITYKDLDTGESWLVGRYAQEDSATDEATESDDTIFGRQRYFSPMFKAYSRAGLGIALLSNKHGDRGNKRIIVQTGLPPKFRDDTPLLREALSGHHHFSLQIGSNPAEEFDFYIAPSDIYVTSQPMGTLNSISLSNEHKYVADAVKYLNGNVLIFDAGFKTFDLCMIKSHRIDRSETFTNLGMLQIFAETAAAIKEKYGETISVTGMQKYLESGTVRCYNRRNFTTEEKPFDDMLEEARGKVCDKAIEMMAQAYPLQDIDYLVITGGTGAAWGDIIRKKLSGMQSLTILDGNQNDTSLPFVYANVRVYFMYRYSKGIED